MPELEPDDPEVEPLPEVPEVDEPLFGSCAAVVSVLLLPLLEPVELAAPVEPV